MKTLNDRAAEAETYMTITQKNFGTGFRGLFGRMVAFMKAYPGGQVLSADDPKARTIAYLFEVPGNKEVKISIPLIEVCSRQAFDEGTPKAFYELIKNGRGRMALADLATMGINPCERGDILERLVINLTEWDERHC